MLQWGLVRSNFAFAMGLFLQTISIKTGLLFNSIPKI